MAGCLLGATLALALVLASRPASGGEAVGAEVSAYAPRTGELAVAPPGPQPFLRQRSLRAGEAATGSFTVTNQTGIPRALRPRALPSDAALDGLLRLELRSGDQLLLTETLGMPPQSLAAPLVLQPGETATLELTVSLPERASAAAAAALVDVAIQLQPQVGGE